MRMTSRIAVADHSGIGEARRRFSELIEAAGAAESLQGKFAIVVTELATNLYRHAKGGEILATHFQRERGDSIELLAIDKGPGMANPAECMRDGYSTSGTAGAGLGSIQRNADAFQIHSTPGRGTAVWVSFDINKAKPADRSAPYIVETGGVNVPHRGEPVCGDGSRVYCTPDRVRVILADGLGHGAFAADAAREAIDAFNATVDRPLPEALLRIHEACRKTRGAAVLLAEARFKEHKLLSVGAGNVSARVIAPSGDVISVACHNGTAGAILPSRIQEFTYPWNDGSLLVLHSDGIAPHWRIGDYPGLSMRHPSLIAGVLFRDFGRTSDDVTAVVIRQTMKS